MMHARVGMLRAPAPWEARGRGITAAQGSKEIPDREATSSNWEQIVAENCLVSRRVLPSSFERDTSRRPRLPPGAEAVTSNEGRIGSNLGTRSVPPELTYNAEACRNHPLVHGRRLRLRLWRGGRDNRSLKWTKKNPPA
jgi:hypothetical protein